MSPLLSLSPSSASSPPPSLTRWVGIAFVLLVHGLLLWALMAHRLLPMPEAAVTLMVNFIAPPAPPAVPQVAPPPKPAEPQTKPLPKPPAQQLVAQAPVLSPAEPVAAAPTPTPPNAPVDLAPPAAPAMPLSVGPVALGGELSVVCPTRQPPVYPPLSRRLGETGKVILRVTLDEQGKVAKASVDRSSGFSRLDEAALAAVSHWRCTPVLRNGQAVEATALQPFNFVLEGN